MKMVILNKDKILKWIRLCNESKDPGDEIIRIKMALKAGFDIQGISLLINAVWIDRAALKQSHWHTPFGIVVDNWQTLSWKEYD
jgi:hypothetical protein